MDSFFSTRQAARKLGIDPTTLSRYIANGKVPAPKVVQLGGMRVHGWSEQEIEQIRQLLPKIANGRKTRYQNNVSNKQNESLNLNQRATPGALTPNAALNQNLA